MTALHERLQDFADDYPVTCDLDRKAVALLREAATALQSSGGEVVGWYTDDHLTDRSATTYDKTVADRWVAKGWPITPIYTTPPRHPADEGVGVERAAIALAILECGRGNVNADAFWIGLDSRDQVRFRKMAAAALQAGSP